MKAVAGVAVLIPVLAAQSARAPLHSVTAVRHWTVGEITRVAVEISGEFQFRTDRLHNPERAYFDILDARPRIDGRRLFSEEVSDKLLKRIRVAETAPGIARVVLELADNAESQTSELINPNRLIIELRAGTPAPPSVTAAPSSVTPISPSVTAAPPPSVVPAAVITSTTEPSGPVTVAAPLEAKTEAAKPAEPLTASAAASAAEIAKSARHTSAGQNSLIRALGLKINRVVIDPGHGGHDEGTSGPKGLLEKDLVLDVAKRVGKLIEERMSAEVIYTRTDDTFIPLEGRTVLANEKKADLFLSIHANSSPATQVAGIETYYLNVTDSKDALDIAARENATSQKSVFELRDIIQKITAHDKAEESREFAGRVQAALYTFSARNNPAEKNRGVRKAPFLVLIGANMPSILTEIGFLSNSREETLLKKPEYRQKLAEALYRGVSRYAEGLSHFQLAQN